MQDMLNSGNSEFAAWYASAPPEEKPIQPTIEPHQQFYWLAWHDLCQERHQDGFGNVGPIFYATLSSYAADHCIRGEEFMIFKRLMKEMDSEYLDFIRKKKPSPESS
jgi:hypothetical protein